jgi:hypothetical protein
MTCAHVLGLIDAGPFADYPSAHLAAAWAHATGCPTCGAARQAADAITAELTALPQPVPPSGLAELVMARITRIPEPLAADMSAPLRESAKAEHPDDSWSWAPVLGALSAALAIVLVAASGDMVRSDLWSLRTPSLRRLLTMPELNAGMLGLVACLLVYIAALFPTLHSRRVSDRT